MSPILFCLTLLGAAAAEVQTREVPTTRLYVETSPPGAAIKLDGKPNGSAPKVFLVPPETRKMIVEVELDGHAAERREVTIQGGRVTRIEFLLQPWHSETAAAAGLHGTAAGKPADAQPPFAIVAQAVIAASTNLRSGEGNGTYRTYDRTGKLAQEISFHVFFDKPKCNLTLTYGLRYRGLDSPKNPHQDEHRVIVSDGSLLLVGHYGKNYDPTGASGEAYVPPQGAYSPRPLDYYDADFPRWDLSATTSGLVDIKELVDHPGTVERLPGNVIRGTCVSDMFLGRHTNIPRVYSFEAKPDLGYNIVSVQTAWWQPAKGDAFGKLKDRAVKVRKTEEADWNREGGIWYVQAVRDRTDGTEAVPGATTKILGRSELRYEHFRANPVVANRLFTFAALAFPPGTPIEDRRQPQGPNPTASQPVPARMDIRARSFIGELKPAANLAAQFESLPPTRGEFERCLGAPTEIDFVDCPLVDVLGYLNDYHIISIRPDRSVDPGTLITQFGHYKSLRAALEDMLGPKDMTWRIDPDCIRIIHKEKNSKQNPSTPTNGQRGGGAS
jgi:hypothetical protein